MTEPKKLQHIYFKDTCLPYRYGNNLISGPQLSGGYNVLTSYKGFIERFPGFAKAESTATVFTGNVVRAYTWEKWDGSFYIMVNEIISGSASNVYKYKVGTDSSFVLLYSDVTTAGKGEAFDFAVSNNTLYFGNGPTLWAWDGTNAVRPWGIGTSPMNTTPFAAGKPTETHSGAGSCTAINGGWQYVFTYYNSTTGHQSSASNPSVRTGNMSSKAVVLTGARSTDAQVDKIRIYRTTDGGGGIYFEHPSSPITNPVAGAWTFTDNSADSALMSFRAPVGPDTSNDTNKLPVGANDPPSVGKGWQWFANRLWGFSDNKLYYSGWEEVDDGLEEECFPASNVWYTNKPITGLSKNDEMLLVFTASDISKITGDTLDTFSKAPLFSNMGVRNRNCISRYGRSIAWLDTSDTVRITDGFQQSEVSQDIRAAIAGINHSLASLTFYSDGVYHWLCLMDGGNSKLYVYDLDRQQWMPPVTAVGASTCVSWGETASGTYALFCFDTSSKKLLQMTPSSYQFNGANYSSAIITSVMDLTPDAQPSRVALPEVVTMEVGSLTFSAVYEIRDDDPDKGTWESIGTNTIDPPYRTQGAYLKEYYVYTKRTACKRIALKVVWPTSNANFQLYSLSIGLYEVV